MGGLHPAGRLGHRDRRDLRARRARLHAAVAGVGHDQLRAGRVRDAAGVRDAVLRRAPARRCGSRSCSTCASPCWCWAGASSAAIVDPLIKHGVIPLVIATLGLSIGAQVGGARRLQRRGASVPEPVPRRASSRSPASTSRYADIGTLLLAGADRHRRCRRSSTRRSPAARCRRSRRTPRRPRVLGIDVQADGALHVPDQRGARRASPRCWSRRPTSPSSTWATRSGTKAFFAAIIGGFNQTRGALLGGVLIGVLENLVGFYVSPAYKEGVALMLFLVVILFRPEGPARQGRGAQGMSAAAEMPSRLVAVPRASSLVACRRSSRATASTC